MKSRVSSAIERALEARHREATVEVERILQAALVVMERSAPAPPRLSDIVAEAGTHNAAFYRYFASKDELMLAVLERGVRIVAAHVDTAMSAESAGLARVARWVEATMAQVSNRRLLDTSRSVLMQMSWPVEDEVGRPLRELLASAMATAGSRNPKRDTDVVFTVVMGRLRAHVAASTEASRTEIEHLVDFCLKAVDPETPVPSRPGPKRRTRSATRSG